MKDESGSQPAFPAAGNIVHHVGLTKREWFAGQALIGLLASSKYVVGDFENFKALIGKSSFEYADAMLAAGEGKKE